MTELSGTWTEGVAPAADGARLAYWLGGHADGPRVVFVHSLGLDQRVWQPVAERVAARMAVLLYDLRGHGGSARTPGPYDVDGFARDLEAVLDAVGWPSATIAGASLGGSVGLALAAARPQRVEALLAADSAAWYGPDGAAFWEDRARHAEQHGLADLVDFQLRRWYGDDVFERRPDLAAWSGPAFLANDPACYAATCRLLGSLDLRARLSRVRAPTLVAVGALDAATPEPMARAIHDGVPGAALRVLPDAHHLSPLEQPDAVAALIVGLAERARAEGVVT